MKQLCKKLSVILISTSLLMSQNAFAARMGKSRSVGMQRSTSTMRTPGTSYNNSSYRQAAPTSQAPTAANNGGGSRVGTALAGAAAGAVGGYMLGKAMNSNNEKLASSDVRSEEASTSNESHIPWGIIAMLGMLLAIGLMIFRRKSAAQTANQANYAKMPNNNDFNIPTIRKDNAALNSNNSKSPSVNNQTSNNLNINERMPDGVEAQYFLRQAKGMFLHIQSMNTTENVTEVAKYMTPELYVEIKETISNNDFIADFSQLECQLLEATTENGSYIASVKFYGKVSESPDSPVVDFAEIWNFIKPVEIDGAKWLVAGIQQAGTSN